MSHPALELSLRRAAGRIEWDTTLRLLARLVRAGPNVELPFRCSIDAGARPMSSVTGKSEPCDLRECVEVPVAVVERQGMLKHEGL